MIHESVDGSAVACDNRNMLFSGGLWRVFSLEVLLATAALIVPASPVCAPVYAHDPQIVREGAWYYMFSTGQGIPVQ